VAMVASQTPRKGDQAVDPSYTNQIPPPSNDETPRTYYGQQHPGQYSYQLQGAAAQYYSPPGQVALAPLSPFAPAHGGYAPPNGFGSPPPNNGYPGSQQLPTPNHNSNMSQYNSPPPQQQAQPYPPDPQFSNYAYQPSPHPQTIPPASNPSSPPVNSFGSGYGYPGQTHDPSGPPQLQRSETYQPLYPRDHPPPLQRSWGTAPGNLESPRCMCGHNLV
jgi:hypothetical protein